MDKSPNPFKILAPTAILGYGYPESSFEAGLDSEPDLIAVDAGSTDPGPYYLGAGKSFTDRGAVKRDLRHMIRAGVERGIPVVVGTCGGAGARPHLQWCRKIVDEIAREEGLSFRLGEIFADVSADRLLGAAREGRTEPMPGADPLAEDAVEETTNLVAQMGLEPIMRAHEENCDVILAGRAYDAAVFAALPVLRGYPRGLALHMGKILECAAIAADPGSGSDCALGLVTEDSFTLAPLGEDREFTRQSVAAHSLYEKADPRHLTGPGGYLDLEESSFTQLDDGRVRVAGSEFYETSPCRLKIEGARRIGYRTICVAGTRDPTMIRDIDEILDHVRKDVDGRVESKEWEGEVYFHLYGRDGVMGDLESEDGTDSHELGIVIEAVGPDQQCASSLCSITRSTLLHYGYPGRVSTAGNLAFPFSPSDLEAGEVYEFSVYHLMEVESEELFDIEVTEL